MFTGFIKEFELLKNKLSGKKFYWFLVDTLGSRIDVVADKSLIQKKPIVNGILTGHFWLSGKIIT